LLSKLHKIDDLSNSKLHKMEKERMPDGISPNERNLVGGNTIAE